MLQMTKRPVNNDDRDRAHVYFDELSVDGEAPMKGLVITRFFLVGGLLSLSLTTADTVKAQSFADLDYLLGQNCSKKLENVINPAAGGEAEEISQITFTVENGRLSRFLGLSVDSARSGFITTGETWSWGGNPFSFSTQINQGFFTEITCEEFYNIWALDQLVEAY